MMRQAIDLARASVRDGGGPFGCVIVRDGKVIATGRNQVVPHHDPTAHAEVEAIRAACSALGTHLLSGCELYTSCEPCPMCLAAIWWARLDRVYFGATRQDAAAIGFDDERIYAELAAELSARELPIRPLLRDQALQAFADWRDKPDRVEY
ncbi:MAG: nucleoside deaminase [Planctomycetota bacterium]